MQDPIINWFILKGYCKVNSWIKLLMLISMLFTPFPFTQYFVLNISVIHNQSILFKPCGFFVSSVFIHISSLFSSHAPSFGTTLSMMSALKLSTLGLLNCTLHDEGYTK